MLSKTPITVAVLTAFALAAAAPSFAQQTPSGQSSQEQMTPGAAPNNDAGAQTPKKKKKKPGNTNQSNVPVTKPGTTGTQSGAADQGTSAQPSTSNQTDVPTTKPGTTGTQSGAAGADKLPLIAEKSTPEGAHCNRLGGSNGSN